MIKVVRAKSPEFLRLFRSQFPTARPPMIPAIGNPTFFRGFFTGLLLVSTMFSAVSIADAADDGLDKFNVAVGLYKQSRWKQAADQFREFLKIYEKHERAPSARLYLGLTLVNNEDFKLARDEFRKFVEQYPQNPYIGQARYRIGESSYLLDDLTVARVELESFVREFPNDPLREHALPYLGDTLLRLNDPAAALKMFDLAIEQYPAGKLLEDAKFGRARSLELLKRFDDAIRQYQEIVGQKDGLRVADAQFHLGASYFERKQFVEAVAAYTAVVKDFPTSSLAPAARLNIGYALFQSGRFGDAVQQFQLAGKEPSQQVTAGYWLGRSLKSNGEFAKALEVLKDTAASAANQPLMESILFEQGLCERYLQHPNEARNSFEQVISKYPKGELADDSLHALIEMSIEGGDLAAADQLLARFQNEYPQSGLRLHIEMLKGRLELARASQKLRDKIPAAELNEFYESAARRFEVVMKESTIPKTQGQARYYLALTRQLQGVHDRALDLIAPLVEKALAEQEKNDFSDALVLQADSFYQQKKYDSAADVTAKYITRFPNGRQMARALSLQALVAENRNEPEVVTAALNRLGSEFPDHPIARLTIQQLAEVAETRGDWITAGRLYESIHKSEKDPEKKAYALRGIALSQFEQKDYAAAADTFARVVSDFPKQSIVLECSYYQAECLKRSDQPDKAIEIFRKIFNSVPEGTASESGAEQQPPTAFYYKAGLQAARILNKQGNVADADTAYEALLKRFPKPTDLDKRLDEWAIMNYTWAMANDSQERFERSDAIWRRLVNEVPLSPLASSAKLSLAESDLLARRFEEARQAFEELADSDKSSDETRERSLYQLLILAVDRQRWTDVRTIGKRLTAKYPDSPHRFYVIYSEAESYLAGAKPSEHELLTAREDLQLLRLEAANETLAKSEWFDRVWVLLAELNFREQKYPDVFAVTEDLRQRNAKSPFLHQAEEIVGRSYKQMAKFDEARAAFERVLADPAAFRTETAAKAQFMIGETFFLQEKWDAASIAYQYVYNNYKFPEWQAAALLSSGKCDEEQNSWKLALETYKRVIKEFPGTIVFDEAKKRMEAAQKRVGR